MAGLFSTGLYDYRARIEQDPNATPGVIPTAAIRSDGEGIAARLACMPPYGNAGNDTLGSALELSACFGTGESKYPPNDWIVFAVYNQGGDDSLVLSVQEHTKEGFGLTAIGVIAFERAVAERLWGPEMEEDAYEHAKDVLWHQTHFLNKEILAVTMERRIADSVAVKFGISDDARPWTEMQSESGLHGYWNADKAVEWLLDQRGDYEAADIQDRILIERLNIAGNVRHLDVFRENGKIAASFKMEVDVPGEKPGTIETKTYQFDKLQVEGEKTIERLARLNRVDDARIEISRFFTGEGESYPSLTSASALSLERAADNQMAAGRAVELKTAEVLGF